MLSLIKRIAPYFEFLKTNVKKDFRGKYKKSLLGILWSFINPLLQITIYSIVFPLILKVKSDNYVLFLVLGLIPWVLFSNTLQQSSSVIYNNSNLIKKVYFPREILPLSMVISNIVNFIISNFIILVFIFIYKQNININYIYIPYIYLIFFFFITALSMLVSALTVFLRDIEHFISVFLMLFFYLTPVLYDIQLIPENFRFIFNLNPLAIIINSLRDIVISYEKPNLFALSLLFIILIVFLEVSLKVFNKIQRKFAEEL